jgi:hypothetical protein
VLHRLVGRPSGHHEVAAFGEVAVELGGGTGPAVVVCAMVRGGESAADIPAFLARCVRYGVWLDAATSELVLEVHHRGSISRGESHGGGR